MDAKSWKDNGEQRYIKARQERNGRVQLWDSFLKNKGVKSRYSTDGESNHLDDLTDRFR